MAAAAPHRIEIVPWGFWKSSTTALTRAQASNYLGGGEPYSDGTINHETTWDVLLDSGTWALTIQGLTDSNRAICTHYLDATSLGTLDWYSASTTQNVTKEITGFTVSAAGWYTFKIKATSKNASSSSYYYSLNLATLRRTGA